MTTPRVLVIGIDGATPELIEPWAEAGELPALSRLMREGAYGRVQAWPSMNSAAAWTSLVTGCNPAKHGIYDFGDIRPWREQRWRPVTGADRKRDPFWRYLSAAGQKVGLVNVPISYPADQVTEFALAGLDAPDVSSPGFAHPPSLIDELLHQGIDYCIDLPSPIVPSIEIPHRLSRPEQQMIEARARAVCYLMAALQWDVLMAVFVAADRIQHFSWPDADALLQGDDWMPVRNVYRRLDSFVGGALEIAGADTTVLVVSDHGAGPYQPTTHCLNQLFAQLGLLRDAMGRAAPGETLALRPADRPASLSNPAVAGVSQASTACHEPALVCGHRLVTDPDLCCALRAGVCQPARAGACGDRLSRPL
jgi:predicted AlkP superfamily phosphohydrolase/phosphomutase